MDEIKIVSFTELTKKMKQELVNHFPMIKLYDGQDSAWQQIPFNEIEIVIGWDKTKGLELLRQNEGKLKWIQSTSAGVDYFPLDQLAQQQVQLVNASGVQSVPITEQVLGMLLMDCRMLKQALKDQENKVWNPQKDALKTLRNQQMLIIGTGNIGQMLGQAAQTLGVHTYGINTTGRLVAGFEECYSMADYSKIIGKMDIIINILPLTPATKHFYDAAFFNLVKPGVTFINVGRGQSVNTEDLISAIRKGKVRFAGLDVFEEEPLPADSPLWEMDEVMITPHTAGIRPDYTEAVLEIFNHNLTSWIKNHTLVQNKVDLTRGY